jgi:hypothetical protein
MKTCAAAPMKPKRRLGNCQRTAGRRHERHQGHGQRAQQTPRTRRRPAQRHRQRPHGSRQPGSHARSHARLLPHVPALLQSQGQTPRQGKTGLVGSVRPVGQTASSTPGPKPAPSSLNSLANLPLKCRNSPGAPSTKTGSTPSSASGKRGGAFCMGVPAGQRIAGPDQFRRHARPGLNHRPRTRPRLPQRMRLPLRQNHAATRYPHDPGRNRLDHV